jgi:heme exporter protein D
MDWYVWLALAVAFVLLLALAATVVQRRRRQGRVLASDRDAR